MTTPEGAMRHDLSTVTVSVDSLSEFHLNARKGRVDVIAESLEELGQYRTITVNRGTHTGRPNEVLVGNHTVKALRHLGETQVQVAYVDVDEKTARKIVAIDNRANDLADYDNERLSELLDGLDGDLVGTGFTIEVVDDLADDNLLPAPLDTGGTGTGTGEAATADTVQWGFIEWRQTRARITADEVKALDDAYEAYVEAHGTASGFGHHLAGGSKA